MYTRYTIPDNSSSFQSPRILVVFGLENECDMRYDNVEPRTWLGGVLMLAGSDWCPFCSPLDLSSNSNVSPRKQGSPCLLPACCLRLS